MFGEAGRIGLVVPANNGVLEPELWSVLPEGVALYATRILAQRRADAGQAVHAMEENVDRAVDELAATGVDVIVYADMVTSFIMEPGVERGAHRERSPRAPAVRASRPGRRCAMRWRIWASRRFALGTPYPAAIHALAPPFFAEARLRGLPTTPPST